MNLNGYHPDQLKAAIDKEKLTWRSFADPGEIGQGQIATQWNVTTTPTLYLLDPQGVIRRKWVGSPGPEAIEAALDPLVREAEQQPSDNSEGWLKNSDSAADRPAHKL